MKQTLIRPVIGCLVATGLSRFYSYPFESETVGGLVWIHGTDLSTGVGGWSAAEYLTNLSCHNY